MIQDSTPNQNNTFLSSILQALGQGNLEKLASLKEDISKLNAKEWESIKAVLLARIPSLKEANENIKNIISSSENLNEQINKLSELLQNYSRLTPKILACWLWFNSEVSNLKMQALTKYLDDTIENKINNQKEEFKEVVKLQEESKGYRDLYEIICQIERNQKSENASDIQEQDLFTRIKSVVDNALLGDIESIGELEDYIFHLEETVGKPRFGETDKLLLSTLEKILNNIEEENNPQIQCAKNLYKLKLSFANTIKSLERSIRQQYWEKNKILLGKLKKFDEQEFFKIEERYAFNVALENSIKENKDVSLNHMRQWRKHIYLSQLTNLLGIEKIEIEKAYPELEENHKLAEKDIQNKAELQTHSQINLDKNLVTLTPFTQKFLRAYFWLRSKLNNLHILLLTDQISQAPKELQPSKSTDTDLDNNNDPSISAGSPQDKFFLSLENQIQELKITSQNYMDLAQQVQSGPALFEYRKPLLLTYSCRHNLKLAILNGSRRALKSLNPAFHSLFKLLLVEKIDLETKELIPKIVEHMLQFIHSIPLPQMKIYKKILEKDTEIEKLPNGPEYKARMLGIIYQKLTPSEPIPASSPIPKELTPIEDLILKVLNGDVQSISALEEKLEHFEDSDWDSLEKMLEAEVENPNNKSVILAQQLANLSNKYTQDLDKTEKELSEILNKKIKKLEEEYITPFDQNELHVFLNYALEIHDIDYCYQNHFFQILIQERENFEKKLRNLNKELFFNTDYKNFKHDYLKKEYDSVLILKIEKDLKNSEHQYRIQVQEITNRKINSSILEEFQKKSQIKEESIKEAFNLSLEKSQEDIRNKAYEEYQSKIDSHYQSIKLEEPQRLEIISKIEKVRKKYDKVLDQIQTDRQTARNKMSPEQQKVKDEYKTNREEEKKKLLQIYENKFFESFTQAEDITQHSASCYFWLKSLIYQRKAQLIAKLSSNITNENSSKISEYEKFIKLAEENSYLAKKTNNGPELFKARFSKQIKCLDENRELTADDMEHIIDKLSDLFTSILNGSKKAIKLLELALEDPVFFKGIKMSLHALLIKLPKKRVADEYALWDLLYKIMEKDKNSFGKPIQAMFDHVVEQPNFWRSAALAIQTEPKKVLGGARYLFLERLPELGSWYKKQLENAYPPEDIKLILKALKGEINLPPEVNKRFLEARDKQISLKLEDKKQLQEAIKILSEQVNIKKKKLEEKARQNSNSIIKTVSSFFNIISIEKKPLPKDDVKILYYAGIILNVHRTYTDMDSGITYKVPHPLEIEVLLEESQHLALLKEIIDEDTLIDDINFQPAGKKEQLLDEIRKKMGAHFKETKKKEKVEFNEHDNTAKDWRGMDHDNF